MGANLMFVDPQFVSLANNEFSLRPGSECINVGNPAVQYNDPDGSRNDLGAVVYDGPPFICGDGNSDNNVNILDITFLINYLYNGGSAPQWLEAGDVNSSGQVNILDITYLINYLYSGGGAPYCTY